MNNELETIIKTASELKIFVSEWDDGGAWINILQRNCNMYTGLTRAEAEQLIAGLQAILAKGAA
jgi:hypothetical protein